MASESRNALVITDSNAVMWIHHYGPVTSDISRIQNNICFAVGEFDWTQQSAT